MTIFPLGDYIPDILPNMLQLHGNQCRCAMCISAQFGMPKYHPWCTCEDCQRLNPWTSILGQQNQLQEPTMINPIQIEYGTTLQDKNTGTIYVYNGKDFIEIKKADKEVCNDTEIGDMPQVRGKK